MNHTDNNGSIEVTVSSSLLSLPVQSVPPSSKGELSNRIAALQRKSGLTTTKTLPAQEGSLHSKTREISLSETSDMTQPVTELEEGECSRSSNSSSGSTRSTPSTGIRQQQQFQRQQQQAPNDNKHDSHHSMGGRNLKVSIRSLGTNGESFQDERSATADDYDSEEARDNFEGSMVTPENDDGYGPKEPSFRNKNDKADDGDDDDDSFLSSDSLSVSAYSANASTADSKVTRSTGGGSTVRLAKREAATVRWGRITAISVILVMGSLLVVTILTLGRNEQTQTFQLEFENFSQDLGTAWQQNAAALFVAIDALAVDVSLGTAGSDWPFVTVPEFGVVATSLRYSETSIVSTSLAPMVSQRNRAAYEIYTANHRHWINETLAFQLRQQVPVSESHGARRLHPRRLGQELVTFTDGMADQIYEVDSETGMAVVDRGPSPYFPIRTIDPLTNTKVINYNLASDVYTQSNVQTSYDHKAAVMGPVIPMDHKTTMIDPEESEMLGSISYPVFKSLDGTTKETVGVLTALFTWPTLLEGVLPAQAQGISCVIKNTCNQTFTVQVDGAAAFFAGGEDGHDTSYDMYGITYKLEDGLTDLATHTVSRVDFEDQSPCQYFMTVYPSVATEATYDAKATTGAAIAAGVAFFMALVVFVSYDCIQERRNREVLQTAHDAKAIISSLFPSNIPERLFQTNREKQRRKKKYKQKMTSKITKKSAFGDGSDTQTEIAGVGRLGSSQNVSSYGESPSYNSDVHPNAILSPATVQKIISELGNKPPPLECGYTPDKQRNNGVVSHPRHRLKNFLSSVAPPLSELSGHGSQDGVDKPIADLFPHTTVLFADIAGFTAWSSEREPDQVFTLLQTVYQSFDKIAKKRGVFKVETIGDCYVAVTGLPDSQPDHAVRMAKFARECMTKMGEVTKGLEISLGPDTGDLCLRVGMNSGPVTAGVLQGEKSRFQLFGDTVNTASRMESTGEKHRIQASVSTANLLKEAGKAYWVKAREDLVHAKGKGKIQTYWVVSSKSGYMESHNSSDNPYVLGGGPTRGALSRTRSMLTDGGPTRGVQRTTSDTVTKVARASEMMMSSQSSEAAEKREERLVQWQLDLFVRLLKKIVAARIEKQLAEKNRIDNEENKRVAKRNNTQIITPNTGDDSIPNDMRVDMDGTFRPTKPLRLRKDNSFKVPTRRPSFNGTTHSVLSWDTNQASLLGSSSGDFSFSSLTCDEGNTSRVDGSRSSSFTLEQGKIVVDEVAEVISLPQFTPEATRALINADDIQLSETVVSQLKDYIAMIAHSYRKNHFHNFEHASHVTMSANKLLNRIVTPENVDYDRETNAIASDLHDYTYGITSDPLTQFAVLFSALIHDVDHTGVSNGQLAKENPEMAELYRGQSIAEQNSVDLAWDLFMDPMYSDLQDCIAANKEDRKRFRQLVVNSVMATDIFDPTMKELRNKRWDKAFHRTNPTNQLEAYGISLEEDRNMKATIVIEHIIQASDVAHTMQHWHIYTKWNERLFGEMYSAYECGRAEKNPAESWYQGELWFFDNYVIPLARKLEECNVFGVASDECLNYATANRNEWQMKGQEIVLEMVSRYHKKKFFVAGIAKKRAPPRREIVRPKVAKEA